MLTETVSRILGARGPLSDSVFTELTFNQGVPSVVVGKTDTLPLSAPQLVNVTLCVLLGCPCITVMESEG
jgi:hypothetical protein